MRELVVPSLKPNVVRDVMPLWQARLSEGELAEVKRMIHRSRFTR